MPNGPSCGEANVKILCCKHEQAAVDVTNSKYESDTQPGACMEHTEDTISSSIYTWCDLKKAEKKATGPL
jgi:hypothetical protein